MHLLVYGEIRMPGRVAVMGTEQARSVLDWISRRDSEERNEIALAVDLDLNRDSIPGLWIGAAASTLGLTGDFDLQVARLLFIHGQTPNGDSVRGLAVERSFYSAVFDVDKSVSLLLGHPDPEVRKALLESMDSALAKAFGVLESQARIRRGKGGARSEKPVGLIGLRFLHQASSAGDPHAHIHLMLLATAPSQDGKWITLDGRQIFNQGMRMAVQEFQLELLKELIRRIDLAELNPTFSRVGSTYILRLNELAPAAAALSGASRSMAKAWSEISNRKIIYGLSHRQHQMAWARHRRDKKGLIEALEHELDEVLTQDDERAARLRKLWRSKMGQQAHMLTSIKVRPNAIEGEFALQPWDEQTLRRELSEWYTFNLSDFANVLRFRFPAASADECLWLAAKSVLESQYFVASDDLKSSLRVWLEALDRGCEPDTSALLRVYGISRKHRISTIDALAAQQRIETAAFEIAQVERVPLTLAIPRTATLEQTKILATLASGKALTVVSGVAGSGKTYILTPTTEAARRAGLETIVVARNANLAAELGRELGTHHLTLAALRLQLQNEQLDLSRPRMIVLDEAGLVDAADWAMMLQLSKQTSIQVIAVGDRRQSQPIDGRATFALVARACEKAGAYGILETTYRNREWRDEANAIRLGDANAVIGLAQADGRIVATNSNEVLELATELYARQRLLGEDVVVLARDNITAADLASAVQEKLGILGTHEISKEQRAGIGDTVRARLNDHTLGIRNGDKFTVRGFTGAAILLEREDNKQLVSVSNGYAMDWLELAYASTIDSAQGQTRDRVILVVDRSIGNTSLYSAATRGKQAPLYLVSTQATDHSEVLSGAICRDDVNLTLDEMTDDSEQQNQPPNVVEQKTATYQPGGTPATVKIQDQPVSASESDTTDNHLTESKKITSKGDLPSSGGRLGRNARFLRSVAEGYAAKEIGERGSQSSLPTESSSQILPIAVIKELTTPLIATSGAGERSGDTSAIESPSGETRIGISGLDPVVEKKAEKNISEAHSDPPVATVDHQLSTVDQGDSSLARWIPTAEFEDINLEAHLAEQDIYELADGLLIEQEFPIIE